MSNQPLICHFKEKKEILLSKQSNDLNMFLAQKSEFLSPKEASVKIIFLSRLLDIEADLVGMELLRRGFDYLRINVEDIPARLSIQYSVNRRNLRLLLKVGRHKIDISKIKAVFFRHFETNLFKFNGSKITRTFCIQQWNDAFSSLKSNLKCNWINDYVASSHAEDRLNQYLVAKNLGFCLPATVITNDPAVARDFYRQNNKDIVLKPLHHHRLEVNSDVYFLYTRTVNDRDVLRFGDLVYAPSILQEKIHKTSEVRVTVIGNKIYAAKIEFNNSNNFDDMHKSPSSTLRKKEIRLDPTIRERCIKMVKLLGLRYGAIDLVIDRKGQIFFLELNPTGDWYWIERATALPITYTMAELLESTIVD